VEPLSLAVAGRKLFSLVRQLSDKLFLFQISDIVVSVQVNTANHDAGSANIRLRLNYRPDSDLYVIYTAGQAFASMVADDPPQYYQNRLSSSSLVPGDDESVQSAN
jgi:hypothetical protein